ncbi:VWA domain-containing protein [candidate division KSB1 bacterium]|nr:VWA domain-containing protein [candidate division KSB1 bacterium]
MMKSIFIRLALGLMLFVNANAAPMLTLAVLDFQNNSGNPELDYLEKALAEMLVTNLGASQKLTLVERMRLASILEEHQLSLSGSIDEASAAKIGQLIGADHLLFGTIFESGETIRIDARICNATTGKIILAEKQEINSAAEIIDGIDLLARTLLKKLTKETIQFYEPLPGGKFLPKAGKVLAINCLLDNPYKLQHSNEPSYLLINLNAGELQRNQSRIPLNICMVLDRSGSMAAENKLEFVKKAALFVVDNLNQDDYFSLVSYDTDVYPTLPSDHLILKEALKSKIEALQPGSATNLSGGLLEGYAQVKTHFAEGYVNRVLLLSDGLANEGITAPDQLQKIAADKNSTGFTLSTFGVGDDFNEDLMVNLAEFGGANYYFIDSPDKIPQIFSNELQGLLSVVAQNARIEIQLEPGVQFLELFGYRYSQENNRITISLNDIFSKEEKSILIKLQCDAAEIGEHPLLAVKMIYDDVVISNSRLTEAFQRAIAITTDQALIAKHTNPIVLENIVLFESARLLDEAMTNVDRRDFAKARESIASNQTYLQKNVSFQSSKRLKQQLLNVMRYAEETQQAEKMETQDFERMQKRSKFENYQQKKKR